MFLRYLSVFLLGFQAVVAERNVSEAFIEDGLVPDILPNPPPYLAQVVYNNNTRACLGNNLNATQVALQPNSICWPTELNVLYTLLMIDPDAPSPTLPILRNVKHWLIINIPGNRFRRGDTQATYLSPFPTPGSGPHRYTILIFIQQSQIATGPVIATVSGLNRFNLNLDQFISDNNLTLHAGNYYNVSINLLDNII